VLVPYFEKYKKPIQEIIESRVSCRTFQNRSLEDRDKERLMAFCENIQEGLKGEKIIFHLVEHGKDDLKGMKLTYYGLFKNERNFIVGITERSDFAYVSFGYAFEHVVLKATELGLGTCWLGYFNPYLIRDVVITENQIIPAICAVGYPAERPTFKEKVARFAIRASRRHDWEKLFFDEDFMVPLTKQAAGKYAGPLEYLRLAPSSGNTQPWRVVKQSDRKVFHFFKHIVSDRYEKKHLHDIDLGIAMCHFELGCAEQEIYGAWEVLEHGVADIPAKATYITTWVETN
jgi:nitroreductase